MRYKQKTKVPNIFGIQKSQCPRALFNRSQINIQRQIRAYIVPASGIDENAIENVVTFFHWNLWIFDENAFLPFTEFCNGIDENSEHDVSDDDDLLT